MNKKRRKDRETKSSSGKEPSGGAFKDASDLFLSSLEEELGAEDVEQVLKMVSYEKGGNRGGATLRDGLQAINRHSMT